MSLPAPSSRDAHRPSWSFRLITIAGIPIRIHFTFLLFLAWVSASGSSKDSYALVTFVISIFVCVLLHELGHALVAKHHGVITRDITLYPIGGVAMLDNRPNPKQEFWISLAGPAVNLVLAVIIGAAIFVLESGFGRLLGDLQKASLLDALLIANLTLAIFNMIPAFPMDGGRVLRAALAQKLPEARATQIAGGIGQGLAILLGLAGVFTHGYILMLIAFFVFLGASQEVTSTVTRSFLHGHVVADAMLTNFQTIRTGDSLERAANMLLDGSQNDFPVMNGDEVLGILLKNSIVRGLAEEGPTTYVASRMQRDYKYTSREAPLELAFEMFPQADPSPILVMDNEKLVGMLTIENLSEFVMLEHAKSQNSLQHR